MNGVVKPVSQGATVEVVPLADVVLLNVSGLVDERFKGFGNLGSPQSLVINVTGLTRMTSFGVRQWLKAMDALPKRLAELFLLGCPTFFVDQLNMVLNFGGAAKVLSVVAPYTCTSCGVESGETIDVLAERTNLSNGAIPEKRCSRCAGKLEFDESPESYFAFVNKYGASTIDPRTAEALASRQLYSTLDSGAEKPPRIIKLVHEAVTYFRITGRIGSMFRARPFLVGAEGEIVIDLNEVDSYDMAGHHEWRRLLKNLSGQVSQVSLVDVKDTYVPLMGDTLTLANNISVASIRVHHSCTDCGETSYETEMLHNASWPLELADVVCTSCGGITRPVIADDVMQILANVRRYVPPASVKLIAQRTQLLARALSDANAQTSDVAAATKGSDDAILGKYKIVRRLESGGGLADVFLAKQVGIGGFEKPVMLKKIDRKLLEAHQGSIEQLLDEVKLAGRLTHPNIVQVLDVGDVDGAIYLATEYVHGKSLMEIIGRLRGPMPVAEAVHIAREVANALAHAYSSVDMGSQQLGVVHGDVGPHTIMISYDGAVKLQDFGVVMASIKDRLDPQYLAPESSVDGRFEHCSDLFSLGILLYVLCSGTPPFPGAGSKSIVKKMRTGKFRALEDVASVPAALGALVAQLIAFDPAVRPQHADEVVAMLTDIARRNALESSSPAIGALVTKLFPPDDRDDSKASPEIAGRASSRDIGRVSSREIALSRTASRDISLGRTSSRDLRALDESIAIVPKVETSRIQRRQAQPIEATTRVSSRLVIVLVIALLGALAAAGYFLVWPALAGS
jgi:serine/threonine protein kinase/anti-anti-sigma regulatory factor